MDEISAQFKVVKMESLRSLTSSEHDSTLNEKGKLVRDSNVTVIQVMPSERANRRSDKVRRRRIEPATSASDQIEVLALTPVSSRSQTDGKLMKLHIINVRTGKIQDALMLATTDNDDFTKPKSYFRTSDVTGKRDIVSKEIVRVQPLHSNKPEKTWNDINVNKKYPIKPYKLRNKFTSSKCKCEDAGRMWSCKKIQISIAQCKGSSQFMCCS